MSLAYAAGPSRNAPLVAGVAAVGCYVAALSWSMEHATYDVWGALISVPVLMMLSIPLLRRAIRIENDRWVAQLLVLAFVLKMAGSLARYLVASSAYGGASDAAVYHTYGDRLSQLWLHGQFSMDTGSAIVGTGFVKLLTAAVYTVSGPSRISGYFVFSWFGFWGLYFAYRAFRTVMPDGDHRRYAVLVFLLPSMLFWPSSMGKEAWMTLCVGLIALGAAKLYVRNRGGYLLLALGLAGGAMVRPHVVVFAVAGVLVGYVVAPRKNPGPASAMWKGVGVVILGTAAVIVLHRAAGFLGLTALSHDQLDLALQTAANHTTEGGSAFTAHAVSSPLDFPQGLVTVLFRPFPWEAHNAQALVSALESVVLMVLLASSWRRFARLPRMVMRRPYVAFCVVYITLFVYAFSIFGNFGILVRERVQVLPFVLALAALPLAGKTPAAAAAADPAPVARKVHR
jgi:hypothetical protein